MSTKRWRRSSLENRLIFQAIDCSEWVESPSGGPNIASDGYHQRSTASWAIASARVPASERVQDLVALRWWNDSSLQMRIIARAYGP
jgi:hypothetical protein